ncbi:MAG: response regulator [Treponema sp.]|nr:response regulator [Treponema sp.]
MFNIRKKIILVDDDAANLESVRNSLADKYDLFTAQSGKKLMQLLEKLIPDLILLNPELSGMDGFGIVEEFKNSIAGIGIPVIVLTENYNPENEAMGICMGAADYIIKPFSRDMLLKRIELHLLVEAQKRELNSYSQDLEAVINYKTKSAIEPQNAVLNTLIGLVESRGIMTDGHIERTQDFLNLFIDLLPSHDMYDEELSTWDTGLFVMSSQLHDIGKISVRDSILMKPGRLNDEEYDEAKKHAVYGMGIIEQIKATMGESEYLKHAKKLAGCHHEKWDGTGYPCALKGGDIPLQGRLMAIVDAYNAITSNRPYRGKMSHQKAVEIIRDNSGTYFDPALAGIFLEHEREFADHMADTE